MELVGEPENTKSLLAGHNKRNEKLESYRYKIREGQMSFKNIYRKLNKISNDIWTECKTQSCLSSDVFHKQ